MVAKSQLKKMTKLWAQEVRKAAEKEKRDAEAAEATLPGVVSKTWTEADQYEMDNLNRLLTEQTAGDADGATHTWKRKRMA